MTGERRALIVANDTYDHASLGQLRAPAADADALAEVLGDPEVGGFSVTVVHNEPSHEVQGRIEDAFADSRPDDLLLLHFSGHGIKSDTGELFVAARNTRPDRLGSTAVSADFIQRCMKTSRARSIVLFLDCCYGGAFGEGVAVRAAGPVNVMDSFPAGRLGGGRGRAVISASSAIEYAFEGTALAADQTAKPSVFTSAVVDGLRTGDADRDEDGLVSLDELYDYVFDRVRAENPKQTPGRDVEMAGDLYIARSRRKRLRAAPIPEAVAAALKEANPTFRRGAVSELRDRLLHDDPSAALGALEALREVVRTDTKSVADDAAAAISSAQMTVVPASIDFGGAGVGTQPQSALVEVHGPALVRELSVEADPPLEARVEDDGRVIVTLAPATEPFAGQVTITSPLGSVVVPVIASPTPVEEAPSEATESTSRADALVERRVTPVAAAVAPPPKTAPTAAVEPPRSTPSVTDSPLLSSRARRPVSATFALGGLLILASFTAPWVYGDVAEAQFPGPTAGLFIVAMAAIVAAIAVVVDQPRGLVAAGLGLGVALVAATSLLTAFGMLATDTSSIPTGLLIGVAGELLVVTAGLVTLTSVLRSGQVSGAWAGLADRRSLVGLGIALVGSVTLMLYAGWLSERPGSTWGAIMIVWSVTWLAAGAVATSTRPAALARAFLAGWAITALSQPVSDIQYEYNAETFPAQPVVLVALLGLVVWAAVPSREPRSG
ncbi:caspase family protein [Intrasporangium sp. DVR]|uniref:caspase, EACC1-associated type n=1 Tax=Intrasporangium sp. DVR TaxID=3127867 RepID=UPI00313A74D4